VSSHVFFPLLERLTPIEPTGVALWLRSQVCWIVRSDQQPRSRAEEDEPHASTQNIEAAPDAAARYRTPVAQKDLRESRVPLRDLEGKDER
jgi:hypothetical protein